MRTVLIVIAVVLVTASTSTASFLVITSKNIKNGTIQLVDLSPSAKAGLRAQRGTRGIAGPQGIPGPQGSAGLQGPAGPEGPPATNLWAVINGTNGTLARGRGVTVSGSTGVGEYVVSFNRDVTGCAYVASPGVPGTYGGAGPRMIVVAQRDLDPNGIFVKTFGSDGGPAYGGFHVAVFC